MLTFELRLEHSHSLKDKRQVVKSLKDRLRARFNVAVAEIGEQEMWQRAIVAAVTVSGDQKSGRRSAATGGRGRRRDCWVRCWCEPKWSGFKMDQRRVARVAEAIREELSQIIGFEMKDPRLVG